MSYRGGSSYRGPSDRSRSPPRFGDRRGSNVNVFDARHAGPNAMRNGSDAPRGPRSQFDAPPRGPPATGQQSGSIPRPSLRDAPPLGSGARPFREREYPDRRDRSPLPRDRSPPRKFSEQREFPPRDIDTRSTRRSSRDGPLSASSTYSDSGTFPGSSYRGGSGFRGRGRGDFEYRGGGRGGRRALDERGGDLFLARRERSPPPRFGSDLSRDGREPDRRDDRRFERREDERRPEWADRERERERGDMERSRRDPPLGRLEGRMSSDVVPSANATYSATAAPPINPERLAIIESSGADTGLRRTPATTPMPAPPLRREPPPPEQPAYLNGRADAAAQRYGSRGSSPPTQAPPVPAFSFSVAPISASNQAPSASKPVAEVRPAGTSNFPHIAESSQSTRDERSAPPVHAPTAPKAAPVAPRTHHASPPPMAPRAPRAHEIDASIPPSNRLHGVRSLENMPAQSRPEAHQPHPAASMPPSPGATRHAPPQAIRPLSPNPPQAPRFDLSAPTGPKAVRAPMGQASISPRPPFTSPRSDTGAFQPITGIPQSGTPPPMAPSGPRRQSFSVSPKVTTSNVPTAPKAARGVVPTMPRMGMGQGPMPVMSRPTERPPFAPSGPRSLQWNQWRRTAPTGPSTYGDKLNAAIPAKRDFNGERKGEQEQHGADTQFPFKSRDVSRVEDDRTTFESEAAPIVAHQDRMYTEHEPTKRKSSLSHSQTITRASFFGGTLPRSEESIIDSSDEEDDELDEDEDATLLEAKHARRERELRAKLQDLSAAKFRATSPLESIARLARLSAHDLKRVTEQIKQDQMDIDDAGTEAANAGMPSATHSSGSEGGQEIATPRAAPDIDVAIKDAEGEAHATRVPCRHSPEPVSLPYLLKRDDIVPLQESGRFRDTLQEIQDEDADFEAVLEDEFQIEQEVQNDAAADFALAYMQWRHEYEQLERVRTEQEMLERQVSTEPGPVLELPQAPLPNAILEGRRLHKNSSEYEIERVIRESEETARIEQEKMDRAARKDQADMEKEARLPDQETDELALATLVNTNRLRDPAKLLQVFSYEPPPDTFTDHEQEVFIAAFKESPKKWGEIASLLEGRTYKDCIHHYYANKWDGRFRDNRTKRFKGGRGGGKRGGGGKATRPSRGTAAMADLNRGEDLAQTHDTSTGRPKRAAAPTNFGEKEVEAKNLLVNPSPAKKPGPGAKQDGNGEEKPAKKQRRAAGEGKPGRKGKAQLANLAAAAPGMSPHKQQPPQPKEEFMRIGGPSIDDANLLTNLQSGRPLGMQHDGHLIINQESIHSQMMADEGDAGRAPIQSKQSASSYWSVPEQTDFSKYIAYFGTDFAAIANHMGTKTQTMIKNHYQRQVDGGRSDLAEQADTADQRRAHGEDMGPPPTPTPITKRKYDNPSGNTPRALAPQTDAMDIDEPASLARPSMMQASPQQLQTKPRYTGSAHGTPIQTHRAVPSPLPPVSTPAAPLTSALPMSRGGLQHPLGARFGLLAENRPEARPNMQPTSMFRPGPEPTPVPPRSQPPPAHLSRTLSGAPHPEFLRNMEQNLEAERSRALQLQAQNEHEARMEHSQPRQHPSVPHTHGSPLNMHLSASAMPPQERRREYEERIGTPSRGPFSSGLNPRPNLVNPNPSAGSGPQFGMSAMAALGRTPYNPSPPKLDPTRPGPGSIAAQSQQPPMSAHAPAPAPPATPAPEPPKKSNLMSILNSEPEEVKPAVKRDSLPSASTTRVASPAPPFSSNVTPQPMANIPTPRRETFGQSAAPHTHFHCGPFGQPISTPGQTSAVLKQEASNLSASAMSQAPKHEWHPRMSQGSQPSPPAPAPLDRDPRDARSGYSFASHRAMFSNLNPPGRANPSPPPSMLGHSRTPSLTQAGQPQREQQRSVLGAGPPTTQASLHANHYGRPEQSTPYSQAPPQATNRAHHSHNNSITQTPSVLDRYGNQSYMNHNRDEEARAYQQQQQQQQRIADQERANAIQRERETFHRTEAEAHELRQRDAYSQRAPQLHHHSLQTFGGGPFGDGRPSLGGMSMREISARDAEAAMQQDQQHRERIEHERRRIGEQAPPFGREREVPVDRYGPRPLDERQPQLFRRQTPQGGPFGIPPPPPSRR